MPGDALDFFGCPLRDIGADLVHAVHALLDEFLVLPAILEDVVQQAPRSPTEMSVPLREADIFGGTWAAVRVKRGSKHEHVGAVDLLAGQDVLQRHRMSFGGVRTHEKTMVFEFRISL